MSSQGTDMTHTTGASSVRWKVGFLLSAAALVALFQRVSISVAGDSIMREFQFSQTRMGTVFSAFVLGYTLFQVPGGMLADPLGNQESAGLGDGLMELVYLSDRSDWKDLLAHWARCFEYAHRPSLPLRDFSGTTLSLQHSPGGKLVPSQRKSKWQRASVDWNQPGFPSDASYRFVDCSELELAKFILPCCIALAIGRSCVEFLRQGLPVPTLRCESRRGKSHFGRYSTEPGLPQGFTVALVPVMER